MSAHGARHQRPRQRDPLRPAADEPRPAPKASLRDTVAATRPDLLPELTRGITHAPMSAADAAPCTARAGAEQALLCPSRRGSRLYWRDGRVTDLSGTPIEAAA